MNEEVKAAWTNKGVVNEALGLMNSMILSGEQHSDMSKDILHSARRSLRVRLFDMDEFGNNSLIEKLAHIEHERWSHWMRWMLDNFTPENLARWKQQMVTPYSELPEHSKESDRKEVRKTIEAIQSHGRNN